MPNLLKSLPREILEKEDSKFIYNVLNPLLFDKIKDSAEDTTVTHIVSRLLEKDIKYNRQFLPEFRIPYNVNSREFHVYMSDGQENNKIAYFGNTELVKELDDLKAYIFFYFSVEGYDFIHEIIKKYYYVKQEYTRNKSLFEYNYKKYLDTVEIKKKKVYKSTYEHFKALYETFDGLKKEFDIVFSQLSTFNTPYETIIDNISRTLGSHLNIKTFDDSIIFDNSKLNSYLGDLIDPSKVINKHIFSGKTIIETKTFTVKHIFELMSIFAMELTTIKEKYDTFLQLITDNGDGYALEKSSDRILKNLTYSDIHLDLDSDNLTYLINETTNELEIYLYFLKEFRIEESSIELNINSLEISPSIHSFNAEKSYGYTIFEYFDEESKYYKITVHNYLQYDLEDTCINYAIENIDIKFSAVKAYYETPNNNQELSIETVSFLDNFVLYKKNTQTGFFEILNVPFKVKIGIDEKEERYTRTYEFLGIDAAAHHALLSQSEIIIGCYAFDYMYEPKLYVDFFKNSNKKINIRYNTIMPYVLIDDVMDNEFELPYYSKIGINEFNTDITKNIIMYDGETYKKNYDEINFMKIINPYNESNYEIISKMTYGMYKERNHISDNIILNKVNKIAFKNNLKLLNKMQYDKERQMIVFMHNGIQKAIPLNEGLSRNLNYEFLKYNADSARLEYLGEEICEEGFRFVFDGIYLKNPLTKEYDVIEAVPTEQINLTLKENRIFFDIFEMSHCIIFDMKKYKVGNLFIDTSMNALKQNNDIMYIESLYGIPRYKNKLNEIIDVDFSKDILKEKSTNVGNIIYDSENDQLLFIASTTETYILPLTRVDIKENNHRLLGMSALSIFYAGNVIPENSNKTFFGRENIYNSMFLMDNIYDIGKSGDKNNNDQQHRLLAEQLDLDIDSADKYNMEEESYIMFKSSTASLKGLESYLKANLKSISQNIGISPVYLIQRNRFISEWARVSGVMPESKWAKDALKDLVADLLETKLITQNYDDLMDIFKNNEYEKFSIVTNNIHNILVQYVLRFINENYLMENLTYYLIHEVWIKNNRKKIIDFIIEHANEQTVRLIGTMTFKTDYENEQLFYIFVKELEKINKKVINSYIPIGNYSDWELYNQNNHVKFDKPFKYEIIDISGFITMPVEWNQPLFLIRPLVDDGLFTKKDYRFLDMSMITNSQITYNDAYNEYVEDVKNKLNRPVDYLEETLIVLNELSISQGFDLNSINLVVVKWIVERHLPNYIMSNAINTVEELKQIIKDELMSVEHPNLIVAYNKIKETTLLGDLGSNINEIYNSIDIGEMVTNHTIRLDITNAVELEYLDKIKKPIEHYFDYLFWDNRYDIITKVLALFTEDVIATSMVDLSFAINVKNTKGDETFDIYEKMIFDIFDEFLPFHSVLDKIIFTLKIMESSSGESVSKQADVAMMDTALIDIMMDFTEKVRINILEGSFSTTTGYGPMNRINIGGIFPTASLKMAGSHDEIPYDFDRSVKIAGYDLPMHDDDFQAYGVDDEWYLVDKETWKERTADLYTPPEFADLVWYESIPEGEFEKVVDTYINDYYQIKTTIFEKDDRIESYFIDYIPTVNIEQGVNELNEINVIEDYLISIDTTFNIRFYNMYTIGHDEFGLDEAWGPEDQTTLIGMKEAIQQHIMHDFYDKINVTVIDSIWTDVKIISDILIPGHDEFLYDEYYHNSSSDARLDREISVMVYDGMLEQGFEMSVQEMSDISIVDNRLAAQVYIDYGILLLDTRVEDICYVNIHINTNRHFDDEGRFLGLAHNEFLYDEYYHNSADFNRLANMVDSTVYDLLGEIKIDFGFMRMLPMDPYADLIEQKFYRANLPGSELYKSTIRDNMRSNVTIFSKDIIRVGLMDLYTLDIIDNSIRRLIYSDIEYNTFGGDWVISNTSDNLINRNIHHDFRENILAIDKYAKILNDQDIASIYGIRAANIEREELFKLELGDTLYSTIKIKQNIDRVRTKIDKDYLKSIKVEDENFTEFKYMDNNIEIRFKDVLKSYMLFNDKSSIILHEQNKMLISQYTPDTKITVEILDNLHYGERNNFVIDGMQIGFSDSLMGVWSNKIFKDSMITSITEDEISTTNIDIDYNFDIRAIQPHAQYGHMGYTEESIERSIESKLTDSLIQVSNEMYFDGMNATLYDGMMHDVRNYYGEYIDVIISDSLKTYIEIVKKPWVLSQYDSLEHNEYPHMYNGISDEFDISTELRESMSIDSYTKLYDHGVYVTMYDRIHIGQRYEKNEDILSVSMVDDLKVISIGFKDIINVAIDENITLNKDMGVTHSNIGVQDRIWYGYKLRDDELQVQTDDNVLYWSDEDYEYKDTNNISLKDWLYFNYTFIDNIPYIEFNDTLKYTVIQFVGKDESNISLKENLDIFEMRDLKIYEDITQIYIIDSLDINEYQDIQSDSGIIPNDMIKINFNETLRYGPGKEFNDSMRIYLLNRVSINDRGYDFFPDMNVQFNEHFYNYVDVKIFKETTNVESYERLKFGPIFKEKAQISINEGLDVRLLFLDDRYGVDMMPHSTSTLEYYNDSIDRSITVLSHDDIKLVDIQLTFNDSLIILSDDQLSTHENGSNFANKMQNDGIIIQSNDSLMYGIGMFDYIWDSKEWDYYGYEVPYEKWSGHIPYDEFPHDTMEHQDQGEDLSQINTGITENLLYGFDFLFKDILTIKTKDSGGFSHWGYQSIFKDNINVYLDNRISSGYLADQDNNTYIKIRNESMNVQYDFNDKIKTHTFIGNNTGISTEEINIYDVELHQVLETIMKYRIYEKIDTSINDNLLTTSLFKHDDYLSLVTDYKTKIDLYKTRSDGSIQRSMTLIKDKSMARVELIFGDGITMTVRDKLHGTEALRPNQYLE